MAPAGMPSSAQPPRLARRLARAPPPAPHPPRRGLRSPPCCAGRLARRSRPALRGALRLVGFAPEGMPVGATRPGIRVAGESGGPPLPPAFARGGHGVASRSLAV